MAGSNARYGWIPDLPDQRDFMFAAPMKVQAKLPPSVDLKAQCPPVYDQGQLGSCTGNGVAAAGQRAVSYSRVVQSLNQLKGALAAGFPVVLGFTVYESFEGADVAATGVVPMPGAGEKVLGGHCVVAVGYDDSSQRFIIRNSWGAGWGQDGYATMPYPYLLSSSLASDFWTIRMTS